MRKPPIIVVLTSVVLIGCLFAFLQYWNFKNDIERARQNYIDSQKTIARNEAQNVVDYINLTRMFIEEKMKSDLREKCIQAWQIADNIYQSDKNQFSQQQLGKIIKDALRPIRFYKGRGYYFMVSMDGVEQLYPIAPQFEGQNLLGLKDDKGNYVIRDEIAVVKKSEEGFVTDYWRKPGEDKTKLFPKISYVKYFAPLKWYIGCGEYLDNVEHDMQEEVIRNIKETRVGKDGYIFINTFDGKAVIINSDKYKEGDNIRNLTDTKGVKVFEEEYKAISNPEGGFISYQWKRTDSSENAPEIAYVKSIEVWKWIVGAGVLVNDSDGQLVLEKEYLATQMKKQILIGFLALTVIFLAALFILRRLS